MSENDNKNSEKGESSSSEAFRRDGKKRIVSSPGSKDNKTTDSKAADANESLDAVDDKDETKETRARSANGEKDGEGDKSCSSDSLGLKGDEIRFESTTEEPVVLHPKESMDSVKNQINQTTVSKKSNTCLLL